MISDLSQKIILQSTGRFFGQKKCGWLEPHLREGYKTLNFEEEIASQELGLY
jgi:hypothetical protein